MKLAITLIFTLLFIVVLFEELIIIAPQPVPVCNIKVAVLPPLNTTSLGLADVENCPVACACPNK